MVPAKLKENNLHHESYEYHSRENCLYFLLQVPFSCPFCLFSPCTFCSSCNSWSIRSLARTTFDLKQKFLRFERVRLQISPSVRSAIFILTSVFMLTSIFAVVSGTENLSIYSYFFVRVKKEVPRWAFSNSHFSFRNFGLCAIFHSEKFLEVCRGPNLANEGIFNSA